MLKKAHVRATPTYETDKEQHVVCKLDIEHRRDAYRT